MKQITASSISLIHHRDNEDFREQICALFFVGVWTDSSGFDWAQFVKMSPKICQPSSASFDAENPGVDSNSSWQEMDELIKVGVRGFYHTHPKGCSSFSSKDKSLQVGFAKSNGSMYLWHAVQPVGENKVKVVCANMINGSVFFYDLGYVSHDPMSLIIMLPMPTKVQYNSELGVNLISTE